MKNIYIKNFTEWNICKQNINDVEKKFFFKERDVWWCSLGVNIGAEIDGKNDSHERPVLILKKHSKDMVSVLPITTKVKNEYYEYLFNYKNNKQAIILTQIRTVDIKRLSRKIGKMEKSLFEKVFEAFINIYKYGSRS